MKILNKKLYTEVNKRNNFDSRFNSPFCDWPVTSEVKTSRWKKYIQRLLTNRSWIVCSSRSWHRSFEDRQLYRASRWNKTDDQSQRQKFCSFSGLIRLSAMVDQQPFFRMVKLKLCSLGMGSMLLDRFMLAESLGGWKVVVSNAFFG